MCVVSAAYIAEEAEGDERSGDTTTDDVHTFLDAILNMSLRFACFTDEAFFLCKNHNFQSCVDSPYENFSIINCQINRILPYYKICAYHKFKHVLL